MDIFLNQLIQFYSNNETKLHHLTTHSTTYWPTEWRLHCDHRYLTSLHPMYINVLLTLLTCSFIQATRLFFLKPHYQST